VVNLCIQIWHLITFNCFKSNKIPFSKAFEAVPISEAKWNPCWLLSNELEQSQTINWLKSTKIYGDTFIGTGCFFTLNAFSSRPEQVDHLVVIDISSKVADFWKKIKKIVLNASDREGAIENTMNEFGLKREDCLKDESCLSTEEQFLKVKKLFRENKFALLLADFSNNDTLEKIGLSLKKNSRSIDTIYESNIGSFTLIAKSDPANGYFKKLGGCLILRNKVHNFLVRNSKDNMKEVSFLEIYVEGGLNRSEPQKRFISTVKFQ
jgi:hypothetical protein